MSSDLPAWRKLLVQPSSSVPHAIGVVLMALALACVGAGLVWALTAYVFPSLGDNDVAGLAFFGIISFVLASWTLGLLAVAAINLLKLPLVIAQNAIASKRDRNPRGDQTTNLHRKSGGNDLED